MDVANIILFIGVLLFAAHFFAWLFSFTKVPDVLLLILVGLILGPVLQVVEPAFFGEAGALFAVVVLAIILFESGTELRLDVMKESLRGAMSLAVASFVLTMVAVALVVWWTTGLSLLLSSLLGAIVGGISSAVVIPLLDHLQLQEESRAMLVMESAVTDVLSIVLAIALLTAYELGQFSVSGVAWSVVLSFLGAGAIGILGGFLWSLVLTHIRHIQNSMFTTPAFVFVLFGLTEYLGWSGPIAALMFGVTMGNIPFLKVYLERRHMYVNMMFNPVTLSEQERGFFSEVVFLLQTLFFVYVGISIALGGWRSIALGVGLAVLMMIVRALVVRWTVSKEISQPDRSMMAVLFPKGMAAAVLATLVGQQIAEGLVIQEITYTVILSTVVLTSALVFLLYRTGLRDVYGKVVGASQAPVVLERSPNLVDAE